jgi:predicted TIM-barrel fold metal-dependent hydrolase
MDKERTRKIGLSLANAAKKGDVAAVAKWATYALVEANPPTAQDEARVAVRTVSLTEDQEFEILIREQDKILIAKGRPAGHDGAERGATTMGEIIDICEEFDLPILLAKYLAMVDPTVSQ